MNLKEKKLFLLDMDGTIYLDNELFDGTTDFLAKVRKRGGKYVFMTNNSSKSVDKYIEKLASLGIESDSGDFLTSVDATVAFLKPRNYRKIYAFGTASFREQLLSAGLPAVDRIEGKGEDIDCLCMGFDTELSFRKLEDACILLGRSEVDYIATNPDLVCPTWYGYVPDCGSVSIMLENATKRKPRFIGKPEPEMALSAMAKFGFTPGETVVVGDRLYTDIACGVNAGIDTAFVLSGEGTLDDIEKYGVTPDRVYKNIREMADEL